MALEIYKYGDRVVVISDKGTTAADIGIVQYYEHDLVRVWWTVARCSYFENPEDLELYVPPTGRRYHKQ